MPYASFAIPTNGLCCPSGGISFSFVSERKRNQKEREFKGCALKNPLIVQSFCAQSRTLCLPSPQLQVTLRRALSRFVVLCTEICTKRKKRRVCTNITSSAPKPSPLDRRSQWNLNRRSQCIEGKARARVCRVIGSTSAERANKKARKSGFFRYFLPNKNAHFASSS